LNAAPAYLLPVSAPIAVSIPSGKTTFAVTAGTIRKSTMSKHTPGPWIGPFVWDIQSPHVLTIGARVNAFKDKDHLLTVDCEQGCIAVHEMEANMRLIAAAPELLEACKRLLKFNEELCQDTGVSTSYPSADSARKVIAKAEGRDE
jgi:hypothetical protein